MKAIWKYPIEPNTTEIQMPKGAEVLCVQTQKGKPCLWALVDLDESKMVSPDISIVGTGFKFNPADLKYVGTFQIYDGNLVWHVFIGATP